MSCGIPFCPNRFTGKCPFCSLLLVRFKASGCGTPSIPDPHQRFSLTPCRCPESWSSCCYGSAGPAPSCGPAGYRYGVDVGVCLLQALDVFPGWQMSWSVQASGTTPLRWGWSQLYQTLGELGLFLMELFSPLDG